MLLEQNLGARGATGRGGAITLGGTTLGATTFGAITGFLITVAGCVFIDLIAFANAILNS